MVGDGELDLVFLPEWFNNLETQWEDPRLARFPEWLASFARVVMLNQRGMGLSDPIPLTDSMAAEEWIEDASAVMDTVGVGQAALLGTGIGGAVALLFAASHPGRVSAVVLVNSTARTAAGEGYPFGSSLVNLALGSVCSLKIESPPAGSDRGCRPARFVASACG